MIDENTPVPGEWASLSYPPFLPEPVLSEPLPGWSAPRPPKPRSEPRSVPKEEVRMVLPPFVDRRAAEREIRRQAALLAKDGRARKIRVFVEGDPRRPGAGPYRTHVHFRAGKVSAVAGSPPHGKLTESIERAFWTARRVLEEVLRK
ncbi:MAG: hypothetical protein AB1405_05170 [Bdellovibrionota bacterium]